MGADTIYPRYCQAFQMNPEFAETAAVCGLQARAVQAQSNQSTPVQLLQRVLFSSRYRCGKSTREQPEEDRRDGLAG